MAVDTVADALQEAIDIKEEIRTAIIGKEVAVPADTPFEDYPGKIGLIKGILQTKNITPTAAGGDVLPDTGYDGFSKVTLPAEANLIPANISEGVSIFGVTGTAQTATFDIAAFFARTLTALSLGVPAIGGYAFYQNTALQSFTDTALATLGQYAFYNCTGLTSFIASASLTELKAYAFYGCQALATFDLSKIEEISNYALYNCTRIANIGTLKASEIGSYGAYYLAANAASGFKYDPDDPAVIGDYGLQYAKITEIDGEIKTVGTYGLANLASVFTKFSGRFTGAIGQYGFANNQYLKTVDFSDSTITALGMYAFYYLGWSRANVSTDPYMELDFRASLFSTVDQYSFGYIRYANIYLPSAVSQINAYAFYGCQNVKIFMQGAAPTLASTSAFQNMSNYKIYAPWTNIVSYTTGTNWSSITSNVIGYAPANTFTAGDTLPGYNAEGYALTWYSDEAKTTQVTTCPADSPILYCVPGATKEKQVITIVNSGPIVLAVTKNGTPVDTSLGFILCENGETYNINASTSEQGYTYYIKVDGVKVTTFPYALTVGSSDITINGTAYDPTAVNPDFAEATWRELKTAVETGVATTLYANDVGKTKEVTLKNGQTVHLRLSNNTADLAELADGTGTTGFGFEFVECYGAAAYQWNTTNTNVGGWNASYMRNTVMPIILAQLPDEVQEVIATVKRKSVYSGTDGTLVESEDKLFCLFEREIFTSRSYSRQEEWNANTQWQYYAQHTSSADHIKQRNGSNTYWYEGSPYNGKTSSVCCVNSSGNASSSSANYDRDVAPAFFL